MRSARQAWLSEPVAQPVPATRRAASRGGHGATKDQLLNRLRRVEGQVRGIERMVDDGRQCVDIITQISAAQAALDKVALGLIDGHIRDCIPRGGSSPERRDELVRAVSRLMHRG